MNQHKNEKCNKQLRKKKGRNREAEDNTHFRHRFLNAHHGAELLQRAGKQYQVQNQLEKIDE
jgi:hypothetical protein